MTKQAPSALRPDKPISRLMREGAAKLPSCTGTFFTRRTDDAGTIIAACAIGMAAVAAAATTTGPEPGRVVSQLGRYLDSQQRLHPVYRSMHGVYTIVVDLMDCHGWPVENIAAWLEREGL